MIKSFNERAHGRVNLIGEHTDYNGGWVLPTAIAPFTQVTLTPRQDDEPIIDLKSISSSKSNRDFSYRLGSEKRTGEWADYLQGATQLLAEKLAPLGQKLKGFQAVIESTMPEGSGLSSSAALEISFLKALRSAFQLKLSDLDLALLGQRIENEFVGAKVGIMDQMACSLAVSGQALFLDTREMTYEMVQLPNDQMDLMIINSGISHRLSAGGGYNERRAQCEEACRILQISQLRDIDAETLAKHDLSELLMKRARHVVTENERVHLAVKAINSGDLDTLGKLFLASHLSMKNDYEVSIPEIDLLVELSMKEKGVYGARLTGGGFGGSIVAITKKGMAAAIAPRIVAQYHAMTGETATILS